MNNADAPPDRLPAGLYLVPVRPGPAGGTTARLFRTPRGERAAVAFTCVRGLVAVLGPRQQWVRLSEQALRALTAPLGVHRLIVDPLFAADTDGRARPEHRALLAA